MSEQTTPDETKQAQAEAATLIADQLGESEPVPRKTIERTVRILGIETALVYLKRTQEIEAAGGMMLPDGSRRRTPGGVYFYLEPLRITLLLDRAICVVGSVRSAKTAQRPPFCVGESKKDLPEQVLCREDNASFPAKAT